jgi:seryl-tRNA synthetase
MAGRPKKDPNAPKANYNLSVFQKARRETQKRLREANKKLQTTLNQTQRNLDELQKNINLTCSKVLDILRDGQEYGHIEDYTEIKR